MSALTKFFFRAPYSLPKTGEIVRWWESRRLAFNLAVGAAGLVTIAAVTLAELFMGGHVEGLPIIPVLVYGIMANLFFSLGPVVDSIVMRTWGRDYTEVGPTLFRYGFVFAVALTLLSVPLMVFRVLLGLIFDLK